ncbi:MAG: hypothetical protein Q8M16_02985 [Pirellulaceae bacterium]|nr:hypothetical protein [Pirellulaceae bacterium]
MAMRIRFSLVVCLLSIDTVSACGQPPRSTQLEFRGVPILLPPPDAQVGQVANTSHTEVLPPSRTSPDSIELVNFSEPILRLPSGFEAMEHSDRLRIWNLPYGVWVETSACDPAQPHCHLDPTGMSYLAYPSLGQAGEITLYFARSSLDLHDPAQRFEKKVRLVTNQTVDFDFAREGGNTGYGNTVKTSLLVELPTPACETTRELPVAAATRVAAAPRPVSRDDDAISSLLRCGDLDPSVFSDRLRISFATNLVVLPSEVLGNVRLCQIAIDGRDRTRLTDKWTLHGKLEVHSPAGTFNATEESSGLCELDVDVTGLPTANDPDHKVLVLKETGLSLQVKLQNPKLTDNTIYKHPLFDYLTRLSPPTEGTIRLTDVKLKLNGVDMDEACTADVSEIQIHFVKE